MTSRSFSICFKMADYGESGGFCNAPKVQYSANTHRLLKGRKSGLAALLKDSRPHLVVVHCLAHRLELAFKDTIKKSANYDKMLTLLLGLYYMYRKSPKQKLGLKRSYEAHQIKVLQPTRVGGTRWLPHLSLAISNFIRGYKAIRSHLESTSHTNAKAEGLAKLSADANVLVFLLSLQELIKPLVRLSLNLQKNEQSLADAYCNIEATKSVLSYLPTKEFDSIKAVQAGEFEGFRVRQCGRQSTGLIEPLVHSILEHMDCRFPASEIVSSTSITNLKNWPSDKLALQEYGNQDIELATNHFQGVLENAGVDTDLVTSEWHFLKNLVFAKYGDKLGEQQWTVIHSMGEDAFNCLSVIDLLRSLPPTSVKNESSFSLMKLTKGKRRPRLNTSTLNDLLTVSLQAPAVYMMQESKLTNFQQRQLDKQLKGGGTLPLQCNPTSSAKKKQPKAPAKPPKYLTPKNYHHNVRSKETIEASGAYERPKYEPAPSHWVKNSAKEKEKLANMMAFGTDIDPEAGIRKKLQQRQPSPEPKVDRFDELQLEIDERRSFLREMEGLGQGAKYRPIIETEVSQLIREMELIDKKRSRDLEKLLAAEDKSEGR